MKKDRKKYAKAFGKKEKILNYDSNTYQITTKVLKRDVKTKG